MGRLVVRPQALIDLDDIFDYIAEDSLDRAITFVRKLHGQMEKLATSPGIGRHRDELLSGLRSFPYGNYLIFYISLADGVDVVRVLNGVRDVVLNGVYVAGNATVYTMANNILPNPGNGKVYTVGNNFTYTFPAESATIFKIPIAPLTDFVVTATAVSQMVNPGHTTTYIVTSTPTGGFARDVSLSVSGLPPQSSASFSVPTVQGAGNP